VALGAPKVMRIHRDVRFSKDKTPYKTHIGAVIPAGDASMADGGCAALYVHLGLDEEFVGVGMYQFGPAALTRGARRSPASPGAALAPGSRRCASRRLHRRRSRRLQEGAQGLRPRGSPARRRCSSSGPDRDVPARSRAG
jgi:uncharacterized protein (DUF2461 family)